MKAGNRDSAAQLGQFSLCLPPPLNSVQAWLVQDGNRRIRSSSLYQHFKLVDLVLMFLIAQCHQPFSYVNLPFHKSD